jgi:hypothetical protein
MAQQHHHSSPAHTRQLHLSLLARHHDNHHEHQLELARQAFILETKTRLGLQAIENKDTKHSGDFTLTPIPEDSTCPSETIRSTEAEHRPTHEEQTNEHQLILAKEMNTKYERSEINCTVTEEEPQATQPSSTAKFQADNHE